MKRSKYFLFGLLVSISIAASAAVFGLFGPATGVLIGNASSYITTAATFPDSVSFASPAIKLTNDTPSPGDSQYYGTNSSGTKGWYTSPGAPTNGSFTGTYTGVSGTQTTPCVYVIDATNTYVTVFCTGGLLTSTATTFTMTGLPTAIQPLNAFYGPTNQLTCINNDASADCAFAVSASSGTMTFYICSTITACSASGWTNSSVKGFQAPFMLIYPLSSV